MEMIFFLVQSEVIPTMYKSVAIPGIMIIFSILWLTAVESVFRRIFFFCTFIHQTILINTYIIFTESNQICAVYGESLYNSNHCSAIYADGIPCLRRTPF